MIKMAHRCRFCRWVPRWIPCHNCTNMNRQSCHISADIRRSSRRTHSRLTSSSVHLNHLFNPFIYLRQRGNVFAGFCLFVCLSVCLSVSQQDNSKNYGRIFLKFWRYAGHGINYQWFNFGRDPAGILDSRSLWNFRYHCVKGGIREPLANRRRWRHLANSFTLAEIPAGYDCFLVSNIL